MSEQQHTKEPWANEYRKSICGGYAKEIFDASGITIASIAWYPVKISPNTTGTNGEANARRIVAAVNACAGIPTDDLEQCPIGGLFNLADHANELVKQRDELLAALNAIEPFIPKTSAKEGGAAAYSANVRAADLVRSAIASVKASTQ